MRHPHPIEARRIVAARTVTLLALGAWLAAAVAGGAAGIVNDPPHGPPALAAFIVIPEVKFEGEWIDADEIEGTDEFGNHCTLEVQ